MWIILVGDKRIGWFETYGDALDRALDLDDALIEFEDDEEV